jgi:hypothetical protein
VAVADKGPASSRRKQEASCRPMWWLSFLAIIISIYLPSKVMEMD